MKQITYFVAVLFILALTACGRPNQPAAANSTSYGTTATPDHNVPAEHQDK